MLKKVFEIILENSTSSMPTTFPKSKSILKTRKNKFLEGDVPLNEDPIETLKQQLDIFDRLTLRIGSGLIKVLKDPVMPKTGSVVYCGLAANQVEHSGIFVGRNRIVHLDGSGHIKKVSPEEFLARLAGYNSLTARSIYVSSKKVYSVGSREVAKRARDMVGCKLKYALVSNNCHKFTSYCLTGDLHNKDTSFTKLEKRTHEILGSNEWRQWDLLL